MSTGVDDTVGMRISVYASEPHFAAHMQPVWQAIPEGRRGIFGAPAAVGRTLEVATVARMPPMKDAVLVAGYGDLRRVRPRAAVYMEHGAGQTYTGRRPHNSYAGGPDRQNAGLLLCQSERVAAINEQAHPTIPTVVVGCPYLPPPRQVSGVGTVAISFHWESGVCPEARGAWRHYAAGLPDAIRGMQAAGLEVLGHGHPRLWPTIWPFWRRLGVEPVREWGEVLARADVFAVDNSSAMYEAAAVGLGVVAMNAPWFRRDVHHGLRFWDQIPGPQIDGPDGLPGAVQAAVTPRWAAVARRVAAGVYRHVGARAAVEAAGAVVDWLDAGAPTPEWRMAADRRQHDPFAPARKVTRRPARVSPVAPPPARKEEPAPAADAPARPQAVTTVAGAVAFIDEGRDPAEREARARLVWRRELARVDAGNKGPRRGIVAAVERALGPVGDRHGR